jgi:hypothetical protein
MRAAGVAAASETVVVSSAPADISPSPARHAQAKATRVIDRNGHDHT